jgi:carbon monoxide dehydrogenase subunit G
MDFGGRYHFATPREAVWRALNDPAVLKACIPGCRKIEWTGPDALALEVQVDLGLIKPVFGGELTLSNVVPALSYTLSGRGKGGLLGLANGSADIVLSDAEGGSNLVFQANGGASGKIMQLGKALIGNRAQAIIDGFFIHFGEVMGTTVTPLADSGER